MNLIHLDLKTFMFCMGLTGLIFSGMSFTFALVFPQRIRGLFEWSLALLFFGFAFLLFMLRDVAHPFFTHYFANLFSLLCTSLFAIALLKYHNRSRFIKSVLVIDAIIAGFLMYDYINFGEEVTPTRSFMILMPSVIFLCISSYLILRNDRNRVSIPSIISSVSIATLAVSMLARIWLIISGSTGASIFQGPSATQVAFLTYAVITLITASLGFILMAIEKLNYEVIQQTAQAEHSNRLTSLGEMAAGIAHEINNPLAIIQFNIDRIQSHFPAELAQQHGLDKTLDRTVTATKRVAKIVKGLLDFSKEGSSAEMLPNYLKNIIEDTLILCSEKIASREIKLELAEIPHVKILCNPVQISQILLNLINNAMDSLETEKTSHKLISIYFAKAPKQIKILVENSGPAIADWHREKIFLPFFTTKEVGKGTGLGLSISLGIAQKHQGDLYLSDKQKTAFVLKLPALS